MDASSVDLHNTIHEVLLMPWWSMHHLECIKDVTTPGCWDADCEVFATL
jgi:hypothetical protein